MSEHKQIFKLQENTADLSKRQRNVLYIFALTFIIMVLSLIPWEGFKINIFTDLNNAITGLPVLGQLFGKSAAALGTWYFREIT
ncbi:YfcC family protein, partial [Streptococcus pyogenes]